MAPAIKVLIVDDSAVARQALAAVLESDPAISVMGTAVDPLIAMQKMRQGRPDVILLDLEMPRMDGLTFLRQLMQDRPLPVVICSSLTTQGAEATLKALQLGAVEVINKPRMGVRGFLEESRVLICDAVKAAAQARLRPRLEERPVAPKLSADVVLDRPVAGTRIAATEKIVVVGASTGGTEALRLLLEALPAESPGIAIVQHMPRQFTAAFAKRLDGLCRVKVREARDGDSLGPGQVLIAPGDQHMLVKRKGNSYFVELREGPLVSRHRPSVDVLFRSAARYAGGNAIGVILTGMGDDGAKGMFEMKEAGAVNLAQDEASCVVYGMPKEAVKRGAVDQVLPLTALPAALLRAAGLRDF